jgi:hypothetical protein
VTWYRLLDRSTFRIRGAAFHGYTWHDPDRVLLADGSEADGPLVRHEMLHALLGPNGHPPEFFGSRCGGVVNCNGQCAEDVRTIEPPPDATVIAASDLMVSLRTAPVTPSQSLNGGWFALIVEAVNPHPVPVWVTLEPTGPESPLGKTFGFDAGPGNDTYTWADELRIAFQPGETKRLAFDLWGPPGSSWADEVHLVRGFFGSNVTQPITLRLVP